MAGCTKTKVYRDFIGLSFGLSPSPIRMKGALFSTQADQLGSLIESRRSLGPINPHSSLIGIATNDAASTSPENR